MFIAVDDTDSRKGMCTTYIATELIREFSELDLLDYPRLVRLNPNVPWKTRGNGAVVIELGRRTEEREMIGDICGKISLTNGTKDAPIEQDILERVQNVIERWAEEEEDTNPGMIVSRRRPMREFYERAVRDIVELNEVVTRLQEGGYLYKGYGNKRGLIGAFCALAWRELDFTYELITYRKKDRWGSERSVPSDHVKRLDDRLPTTFDNFDHEENTQAIAPRSPCPVLYGVRGEDPSGLKEALRIIQGEEVDRWIVFLTNQGTDDHIQDMKITNIEPWVSAHIGGKVSSEPRVIEGGHVFFDIGDKKTITAAAYEPTKRFREIVKKLVVGDEVELWGGVRKEPLTLNIEKMKIVALAEKEVKIGNPICPECEKRMSSVGKNAGFRCKRCGTKAEEGEIETKKMVRELDTGWYETPVSARRHLTKPLKRIEKGYS